MAEPARLEGDSALIVEIPEAEPIVGDLRERHDVAGEGVPAHVTVIYPFLAAAEIDRAAHDRLRAHFARIEAFDYRFARPARLGPATVVLQPEPADRFAALTEHTAEAWPECPPYGGIHEVVIPHLTVGDRLPVDEVQQLMEVIGNRLDHAEPITGRAREVSLLLLAGDRWSTAARYPLRDSP